MASVKATFNPTRLLLELLLVVALAEFVVMLAMPEIVPALGSLGTFSEGLLDATLLVLLAGPAIFWRILMARKSGPQRSSEQPDERAKFGLAVFLTAMTQLVGLVLTVVAFQWHSVNLDSQSKARFEQGLERTEAELARRLNEPVSSLKGMRAAMVTNPNFNRQAFHDYVVSLEPDKETSGMRAFGVIERVQRGDLQAFERRERADGAPDFAVRSSGTAADLFVVKYLEPLEGNRSAWGLDLGQEAVRRAAIESSLQSGQVSLSGRIELRPDGKPVPGFGYLLPVFKKGSEAQPAAGREGNLQAVLFAPVVAKELLGSVAQVTDSLVDFELFDSPEPSAGSQLFASHGMSSQGPADAVGTTQARPFSADRVLQVGGRSLLLRASSSARFEAMQDRSSLAILGVGGALLSFLMALLVWLLAMGRLRAQSLASRMTAELDRMAQVVQHTTNSVTIMDRDMRIVWVNQGFTQITGYSPEDALGRTPGELLSSGNTDPAALQILLQGAQKGVACRVQLINRARDGSEYWADTEVQPTLDKKGRLVGFMEIGSDITQQKKIQLQLEAAMRDARALLNTVQTHAVVSTTDAQGTITDVNQAFCQISGYSREELVGANHNIVRSGLHSQAFWAELWDTISSGRPWRGEICNRNKAGERYWVDSMIAPFVGENGQIEKYISIRIDITARLLAAEQLRQSEATFSASFQAAASGMGFLTLKGQWLRVNPALCEFLGYSEEELQELTLHDTNHPEEWDIDQLQLRRLMDGEIPVYQRAKRYLHRDGHVVWGLASISVVRGSDGQPDFVITQIVDITARKRAEEALSLSSALMEETQSVAKVGGWEYNLATQQLYWTSETYRIHETSPEEFDPTVETSLEFFLPESRARIQEAWLRASQEGRGFDLELEALTTKGRQLNVRTTGSATLESGRVVRLSGIFQDITERTQYERSLHEAREKAELATRSKGQFLANMSHEIRTPMNAILGMLTLLQHTELSDHQRDYASKTESAAKSLLGLINDILDFSKVEAGKMQLDPQPFRLETLLRDLAVILSSNVGSSPIDVLYDIDPAVPAVLLGDALRLKQVLINLGGNAIKFTQRGQVTLRLRLRQKHDGVASIEFAVQDSGIGIAPENQAHIFTGFSQAEASTTRKFGGTGLGLSISKRLVELMGGTLGLQSELGQGSTFYFTLDLPVAQLPAERDERPAPPAPRRALVVDANPVGGVLLAQMLASRGWKLDLAGSGEAALELLAERLQPGALPVEVVYLGWRLPGLDGWATAARLRQLYTEHACAQPTVIMLSANSREALDQRTQQEQALLNGFVVKPVTAAMLLDAVTEPRGAAQGMRRSQRGGASQRRLSGMRILVVEDNLINQQVAEELLLSEGALVSLAANGRLGVEAIAAAAGSQPFDVVLMDIQMPVLDGFAATRIVREELLLTTLPIVAMTANAQQSDREECLSAGMNEHVGKPFDLRHLVNTLLRITGFEPQPEAPPLVRMQLPLELEHAREPALAVPVDFGLDVPAALARMGGLLSLYQHTAREFLRSLPAELRQLQAGPESDPGACARLLHTLKGTAGTLGATALSEAAAALERACKDGSAPAQHPVALQALHDAAAHATQGLQAVFDTPAQTPEVAPVNHLERGALQAALAELIALLDAADLGALEQFATLRDTLAAVPPALLEPLELALQDLDTTQAASHCRAIVDWLAGAAETPDN